MKVSPVSFGTHRILHLKNKNAKEMHEEISKILEPEYEYNDQTNIPEYMFSLPFSLFAGEAITLNTLYYTNEYIAEKPRVYATNFINKDTEEEELFLTGEDSAVEKKVMKKLEQYGYMPQSYGYDLCYSPTRIESTKF